MAWCRPVENDGATQHAATIAVFSQMRQGPAPLPQFWSGLRFDHRLAFPLRPSRRGFLPALLRLRTSGSRSEEHTSELQSLMRISYAVFCLKKKNNKPHNHHLTLLLIYRSTQIHQTYYTH